MWKARVGKLPETIGEPGYVMPKFIEKKSHYHHLRRMSWRAAFEAGVGPRWTFWGLDTRAGYFWGGRSVGKYVRPSWSRIALDSWMTDWSQTFGLPPLNCDRPEYVEALRHAWAYKTNVPPQSLVVIPTLDTFGEPDGGYEIPATSVGWENVRGVDWTKLRSCRLRAVITQRLRDVALGKEG
jgi:hypothetical protein